MLAYTSYFDTLASLGDAASPEWHTTTAGLVVLRLVDDWLDFGPGFVASNAAYLETVRELIHSIPQDPHLQGLFNHIVTAIERTDPPSIQSLTAPLLIYAQILESQQKLGLAVAVLSPLRKRARQAQDVHTLVTTSLQYARVLCKAAEFDHARAMYDSAALYARSIGDHNATLRATAGQLRLRLARMHHPPRFDSATATKADMPVNIATDVVVDRPPTAAADIAVGTNGPVDQHTDSGHLPSPQEQTFRFLSNHEPPAPRHP